MAVPADKRQPWPPCRQFPHIAQFDGPWNDMHIDFRGQLPQHLGSGTRMDDRAIQAGQQRKLGLAHPLGLLAERRIVFQLGLSLQTQEMKIGDAIKNSCRRRVSPDRAAIFGRIRVPMQIHQFERGRMFQQDITDRGVMWSVEALDPAPLKIGRIGIDPRHVVGGDEAHAVAETL